MLKQTMHRLLGVSAFVWLTGFAVTIWAAAERPVTALGVFALLGDTIEVVMADAPTDTRLDRAVRQTIEAKDIGFDNIVLREIRDATRRLLPGATLQLLGASAPLTASQQREIASGAARAELPSWIVQSIQKHKLSHVLIVTRARGDVAVRSADGTEGTLGRGTAEGVGYYIDSLYDVVNRQTVRAAAARWGRM